MHTAIGSRYDLSNTVIADDWLICRNNFCYWQPLTSQYFWNYTAYITCDARSVITARQHAMHAERDIVLPIPSVRPSVPPSVRLSKACIVSKRMDISSHFFWLADSGIVVFSARMEASRHLPRLEAASRQFFNWLGLASASHGLALVLPRSRPYCLGSAS